MNNRTVVNRDTQSKCKSYIRLQNLIIKRVLDTQIYAQSLEGSPILIYVFCKFSIPLLVALHTT